MQDLQALYSFADQNNIDIVHCPLPENGSLSIVDDAGRCYIGMNDQIAAASAEERVHLGHELGHCITGSFYNIYAAVDCRQRHENKADKWAILRLIPQDDLDDAVAAGHTEIWELAEFFGVTEEFMKKAVCYYSCGNLAADLCF